MELITSAGLVSLSVLLCFIPSIFDWSIKPPSRYLNSHDFEVSFQTSELKYSLIASCASTFPIFLAISFAFISQMSKKLSLTSQFPRLLAVLSIFIPDIINVLLIYPEPRITYVPQMYSARMILTFASCMYLMSCYDSKLWNLYLANSCIALFSIGQICDCLIAFMDTTFLFNLFYGLKIGVEIILIMIISQLLFTLLKEMHTFQIDMKPKIIQLLEAFLKLTLIVCLILDITTSHVPIYNKQENYFSISIYVSTVTLLMFIAVYDLFLTEELEEIHRVQAKQMKLGLIRYFSNQLRVPINTVSAGLALIKAETKRFTDADLAGTVKEAVRSCEQTIQILDNILLYDRFISSDVRLYKKNVILQSLVKKTLRTLLVKAKDKSITVADEIKNSNNLIDPQSVYVIADSNRLAQVIHILMVNAIQYTRPKGKITITIQYDSKYVDARDLQETVEKKGPVGTVSIIFQDSGCGIATNRLPIIFEEQIRMDQSDEKTNTPKNTVGSEGAKQLFANATNIQVDDAQTPKGLSLWIAKHIVDMHPEFELMAFSKGPNTGSAFTIRMPFHIALPEERERYYNIDNNSRTSSFDAAEEMFGGHAYHVEGKVDEGEVDGEVVTGVEAGRGAEVEGGVEGDEIETEKDVERGEPEEVSSPSYRYERRRIADESSELDDTIRSSSRPKLEYLSPRGGAESVAVAIAREDNNVGLRNNSIGNVFITNFVRKSGEKTGGINTDNNLQNADENV